MTTKKAILPGCGAVALIGLAIFGNGPGTVAVAPTTPARQSSTAVTERQ